MHRAPVAGSQARPLGLRSAEAKIRCRPLLQSISQIAPRPVWFGRGGYAAAQTLPPIAPSLSSSGPMTGHGRNRRRTMMGDTGESGWTRLKGWLNGQWRKAGNPAAAGSPTGVDNSDPPLADRVATRPVRAQPPNGRSTIATSSRRRSGRSTTTCRRATSGSCRSSPTGRRWARMNRSASSNRRLPTSRRPCSSTAHVPSSGVSPSAPTACPRSVPASGTTA